MRNQLIALIRKDLGIYRHRILRLMGVGIGVALFISLAPEGENVAGSFVTYGGLLAATAGTMWFLEELKGNARSMSASLPVTRRAIVASKYMTSLLVSGATLAVCVLAYTVLVGILEPELPRIVTAKVIAIAMLYVLFHVAVFYMAFFRFEIMVAYVFYVFSQFVPVFVLIKVWRTKDSFQPYFESQDVSIFVTVGGITLVLAGLSFYTSTLHYERKDIRS